MYIVMKATTIIPDYRSQERSSLAQENTIRLHDDHSLLGREGIHDDGDSLYLTLYK
jgi:hypothetical protein